MALLNNADIHYHHKGIPSVILPVPVQKVPALSAMQFNLRYC